MTKWPSIKTELIIFIFFLVGSKFYDAKHWYRQESELFINRTMLVITQQKCFLGLLDGRTTIHDSLRRK